MADVESVESTTQSFLDIHDITQDMVILRDGTASIILQVDAINFSLLAEEEQDAIMYAYAGLLNSLNYTIQILIRSQTKDVSGYLQLLDQQAEELTDDVKRDQIRRYRTFVSELIRERNVLDKKFYVVIAANPIELGMATAQSVIPGVDNTSIDDMDQAMLMDKATTNLFPKRDHLIGQFARIGLNAKALRTQEIIRLFYNIYNPEASEGQQVTNTRDYTTPLVFAQRQQGVEGQMRAPQQQTAQMQNPQAQQQAQPQSPTAPTPDQQQMGNQQVQQHQQPNQPNQPPNPQQQPPMPQQ